MRPSLLPIAWRLLLAVSLVATPLVPMAAPAHDAAVRVEAAPPETAMPCHESPAPAPTPAADAPCDDGCCPLPDCDPGACRVQGAMPVAWFPMLSAPRSMPMIDASHPGTATGPPAGVALRPPIS